MQLAHAVQWWMHARALRAAQDGSPHWTGLAPRAVELLSESLIDINKKGLAILVVEQDVFTAFDLADKAYVIETGKVAMHGSTEELGKDPRVRQAYLGI